mmetsp:Transcript_9126/g.27461  ORF Transcript_9126/g.27461 Transcript_9126/m.27461 type:complete len:219 (+) Transcript_9126:60-716(+)|eukprot:CAMPEP_0198731796 /NCGR_PEP_ID=MMETSP1475-20131203/32184_1 /TAXON_ID= ORGANISM="Unidentified sp., Strain CCMP1999" /NCGR_SAMPLE_ID=MMETSP1475 /ASSEMBLY_ACC=CAM_ASM_001111 /LENGTH=218 /DNA_ID=CAMNT_0044494805 /DNA_START=18 /DNA_END=674 /DNA_ORIENTATION=-
MTHELRLGLYKAQKACWPKEGRHVLAQFDDTGVIVYQAYRKEIAEYAVAKQAFGGEYFSFRRTTWVKPNFLWMMYRCGWATKKLQERVLAIKLKRHFWDDILSSAVTSTFNPDQFADEKAWQKALAESKVCMQWDPAHEPFSGAKMQLRAIQLGLRPVMAEQFGGSGIVSIQDVTPLVHRLNSEYRPKPELLVTPVEEPYPLSQETYSRIISMDQPLS